jgi:translocation and assembly module TamB
VINKAGEWSIKTRLVGSGGQGSGFVAAAMGQAPKASFDGSRLADGRLALRDLVLTGSGLMLEASGGRSLLGGLTFKGKAAISNLAAARAGAAGSASATWSAAQAKAGQPGP